MHPSLSEDVISGSFGDDDDDDYGICRNDGDVCGDSGGGDAPLRFRRSGDAPWGSGDKPLIKVSVNRLHRGGRGSCLCAPAIKLAGGTDGRIVLHSCCGCVAS